MQALTEIGLRPAAMGEKPGAAQAADSGREFTDALEKAAGGGARCPEPAEDTDAAALPETEETKETEEPAETDAAPEVPAELVVMSPLRTDGLTAETGAPQPETPGAATEIPAADMAAQALAGPAEMSPAQSEAPVISGEAAAPSAAPAETEGAESFIRQVTERLEQKLTEPAQPAAEGEPTPEETAGLPVAAEEPADGKNTDTGAGSAEGGETAFAAGAKRAASARTAGADAAQAAAAFSAERLTARLEAAELTRAVERAISSFSTDLRGLEVTPSEITIALDPEELGSVSITISSQENHLTAKIITDNKEAADLISSQMEHYLQSMQEKGVRVEKAEVVYSQLEQDGRSQSGQSRDPRGGQARFRIEAVERAEAETAPPRPEARDVYESAAGYYVPAAGYGLNLEFKA